MPKLLIQVRGADGDKIAIRPNPALTPTDSTERDLMVSGVYNPSKGQYVTDRSPIRYSAIATVDAGEWIELHLDAETVATLAKTAAFALEGLQPVKDGLTP